MDSKSTITPCILEFENGEKVITSTERIHHYTGYFMYLSKTNNITLIRLASLSLIATYLIGVLTTA